VPTALVRRRSPDAQWLPTPPRRVGLGAAWALSDPAHHLLDVAGADIEDAAARLRQAAAR